MDRLAQIVRQEVEKYAAPSFNSRNYPVLDDDHRFYAALSIIDDTSPDRVAPIVVARLQADQVVIEADNTNKPLVDALVQAGIARDKIILAYTGESVPQSAN